jgi:hypothetical protein
MSQFLQLESNQNLRLALNLGVNYIWIIHFLPKPNQQLTEKLANYLNLQWFRAAISKITFSFATNVANKDDHSPHFEDGYKIVHNLELMKT